MAESQAQEHAHDVEEKDPKAQTLADAEDEAQREVDALAEDPPEKLEDWPSGKAKYKTLGGGEEENDQPYGEGATGSLGPPDVVHHEDGSVTVGGEKAENPDDYKGDPIPGGPTDPDAPKDTTVTRTPHDDNDAKQDEDGES